MVRFGGAERDRTVDLLNAIQALSQLSYGPTKRDCSTTNAGYRSKFHDRRANSTVPHSPCEHDSPLAATLPKRRVFRVAQFAADAPAALLRSEENRTSPSSIRAPAHVAGRRAVALTEREAPP